jgi:hypothetical protein
MMRLSASAVYVRMEYRYSPKTWIKHHGDNFQCYFRLISRLTDIIEAVLVMAINSLAIFKRTSPMIDMDSILRKQQLGSTLT